MSSGNHANLVDPARPGPAGPDVSINSLSLSPPCSKDVRLPVQLQRAMAAEAEAAREARAKVRYSLDPIRSHSHQIS